MVSGIATFGGGCFWGVEAGFAALKGVTATEVGYMGGTTDHPTYEQVCTNTTGHVEVVRVTYDPDRIGYPELLAAFFQLHDPTQVGRQGPDVGRQYRSVVFTHGPEQAAQATAARERIAARLGRPVATAVEPAGPFWRAEAYHQQYLHRRGLASCAVAPAER